MKITEKGFYRTRGLDNVFIGWVGYAVAFGVSLDDSYSGQTWNVEDGTVHPRNKGKHDFSHYDLAELIKPYSEEMMK